ncbi:hypothetical protein CL634_00545 [bacterium]|nr:hypothetical protein [bacterium]
MATSLPIVESSKRCCEKVSLPPEYDRVAVVLILPANTDDYGFPERYLRGVVTSNSGAAMYGLTSDALTRILPSGVPYQVHLLQDNVARQARELKRLHRRFKHEPRTKLIVGLVGVQTAQFPRACQIIDHWQAIGATCVIGGFHVSGSIATIYDGVRDNQRDIPCPHRMPEEIQALMDEGTVVFAGEAEEVWIAALADIIIGQNKMLYRGDRPALESAPLPCFPDTYFDGSFAAELHTIDTGRGCPFTCSFCTIINVQGRDMRSRDPEQIIEFVRAKAIAGDGQVSFFITDDNFARNPQWRKILKGLTDLRQQGFDIDFMLQVDLACGKLSGFLEALAAAGCTQVFMGVESMNPNNLTAANKPQNNVEKYKQLWQRCSELGIMVQASYIVGFPHDTRDSVLRDVQLLFETGVDRMALYVLTPLPGSEDHALAVAQGVPMDDDFSGYDTFHPVIDHPRMSRKEWQAVYHQAWRTFYSQRNMVRAVRRSRGRAREAVKTGIFWYRWAFAVEKAHPMVAGFIKVRSYRDRLPSSEPMTYGKFLRMELLRYFMYLPYGIAHFYRCQHIAFEAAQGERLAAKRDWLVRWWRRQRARLRFIRRKLAPPLHWLHDVVDWPLQWLYRTFGPLRSRKWLHRFWTLYARNRWHLFWRLDLHIRMIPYAATEIVLTARYARQFIAKLLQTIT